MIKRIIKEIRLLWLFCCIAETPLGIDPLVLWKDELEKFGYGKPDQG